MMGYNHATMTAGIGIALLPVVDLPTPAQQVAWTLSCAGMGLLADWDAPGSHVARMWGWPSRGIARAIGAIAQGHRLGTHDVVLAPLVFGALFALASRHPATQLVALAVAFGLAIRGMVAIGAGRVSAVVNLALSWGLAWLMVRDGQGGVVTWLPLAAAVGILSHALGDLLTHEGLPVPLVWLVRRRRFSLGLFRTNGPIERGIVAPLLSLAVLWAAWHAMGFPTAAEVGTRAHQLVDQLVVT